MWFNRQARWLDRPAIEAACDQRLVEAKDRLHIAAHRGGLLLPPHSTRAPAGGRGAPEYPARRLGGAGAAVHVSPTLGQHVPHTEDVNRWMFGSIPNERIHAHDWKNGVTHVGTVPAEVLAERTGGAVDWDMPIDLNTMLMEQQWDLIINIGHVVPHEVLG